MARTRLSRINGVWVRGKPNFDYLGLLVSKFGTKKMTPRTLRYTKLVNWASELLSALRASIETYINALQLIDECEPQTQLHAAACVWISMKFSETYITRCSDILEWTQDLFTGPELMKAELDMLNKIDFQIPHEIWSYASDKTDPKFWNRIALSFMWESRPELDVLCKAAENPVGTPYEILWKAQIEEQPDALTSGVNCFFKRFKSKV